MNLMRGAMLSGACSLAALAAGTAMAQDAPPATAPAAAAASAAEPDEAVIKEIVVTARRRNETLQNTPVAITAIPPQQLEATRAVNLTDLQGVAPNVLITTQSTGAATANISIRGIAFADVEKSFDPAVGVMVDGVYIGTSTGQLLDFFDINSLEILRGPQGTLFGRNTIGGVINVRRTRPTLKWGGKFEASYGSYDQFDVRGVVNVPLIKDVLGVKLFEFHQQNHGFYKDAATGKRVGGSNSENFGASFLLEPSNSFNALLTLEEQQQDFEPVNGSLTQPGDIFCGFMPAGGCGGNNTTDIYTIYDQPNYYGHYRARAATLEMNLNAGPVKIASITSYRDSNERQRQDFATNGLYDAARRQTYHQFSQELRASGNLTNTFDYVAGLYYFYSTYHLIQDTNVFGAYAGQQDTTGKSRSEAAFIDFDWKFLPKLRLSGGGRFTHDEKENINPPIYPGTAKKSWSRFTPRVTLDYRPYDGLMLYATWSKGYRSGGFSGRGQTVISATTPYDPETVSVYEVGVKSEFLNRRVVLNVAGYYTDYTKIQQNTTVTLPGGVGNETLVVNAAGAKIKGIEADLTARPTRELTLNASVGYTDANFHGFIVNQPVFGVVRTFDFSDVGLIYAPKLTSSFVADYKVPLSDRINLSFHAGYRYITPYDQQIAADPATPIPATGTIVVSRNDPRLRSDRQNLLDLSATLEWKVGTNGAKAHLTGFIRNALDDRGTATAFNVAAFPTLWAFSAAREPRVFGAQLGFQF